MLISPDGAYSFTLYSETGATPSKLLNMQFMVANIADIYLAMQKCGAPFNQEMRKAWGDGSEMKNFVIQTPNGIDLTVWGFDLSKK